MAHDTGIPDAIPFRTLRNSGAATAVFGVLVLLGAVAALLAWGEPERFWLSLLFNWLFWSTLALGMVIFAVALHITHAKWAWSIRRIPLGGVSFLPVSFLLLPVVFFGYEVYFHHWLHPGGDPIIEAKAAWLNLPFLITRDLIAVALMYGLAIAFAYYKLRPDVYGVSGERKRPIYDRLTRGWRGVREEAERSRSKATKLAPVLGILYAVLWGMIAIDLAMSIEPHFYSTMFPVAFFWTGFHGGVALTAVIAALVLRRMDLERFITVRQFHDLGKLVFAFSVFWMYLNWSQYIVIWYGMLPWETKFFAYRFAEPYGFVVQTIVVLVFLLPFFGLLTRPPKKVPSILAFFATLILVGHWLERFILIYPSLYEGEGALPMGVPEIGIGLGFLGLFGLCYTWYLKTFPILPSPATLDAEEPATIRVPVRQPAGAHD